MQRLDWSLSRLVTQDIKTQPQINPLARLSLTPVSWQGLLLVFTSPSTRKTGRIESFWEGPFSPFYSSYRALGMKQHNTVNWINKKLYFMCF